MKLQKQQRRPPDGKDDWGEDDRRKLLALVGGCRIRDPHSHSMEGMRPYRIHVCAGSRHVLMVHPPEFGVDRPTIASFIDPDSDEPEGYVSLPNRTAHNPMLFPPVD